MTFAVSFGRYGGFYVTNSNACKRVCLGWVALTACRVEIDDLIRAYVEEPYVTRPKV
jgi:hypothetical protein